MRKYLLVVLVVLSAIGTAKSQNVMDPADVVTNFSSGAAIGTPQKPAVDPIPAGTIVKWGRTRNTSRINWSDANETKFKAYFWKGGVGNTANMPYRLRFPNNYNPNNATKYPVILFFHGAGEKSGDNYYWENEDQLFWGAQPFYQWIDQGLFNAFLLFPQEETNTWNPGYYNAVKNVIDTLVKYNNADLDRVIPMGLSSGGGGSLDYVSTFPDRVASVITSSPIGVTGAFNIAPILQIPIWVGDGGTDTGPAPQNVFDFYNAFHDAGGNMYHTYQPSQGHDMWTSQWTKVDNDGGLILADWWNNAHKANPVVYYNRTRFCDGGPINAVMAITPGFNAYQWQKNTNGTYVDIPAPAGTSNQYTATEAGSYRVRFRRTASGNWSDWSPTPVVISVKQCSADTLFKEDFEYDKDYLSLGTAANYKKYQFTCQNSIFVTSVENQVTDATGIQGRRFSLNYTYNCGGYTNTDNVWAMYNNQVGVTPGQKYMFSFSVGNMTTGGSATQLTPRINGTDLIAGSVSPSTSFNDYRTWRRYNFVWTATNSFADLAIKNKNTATSGNDFTLDEISFTRLAAPGGVFGSALWVKANSVEGGDNAAISNWSNLFGGLDLQQTNYSAVPNLKITPTEMINYNPVAAFAPARSIIAQGGGNYAGTTSHTRAHIFMVAKFDNNTQVDDVVTETDPFNSSSNRMRVNLDAPSGTDQMGKISFRTGSSTLNVQATNVTEANKATLWSFSKDDANTASGNKMDIRKNGIVVASNNTTGSFDLNNGNFTLGGYQGKVAEMIYYIDQNITPLSQRTIESYLAVKYGITLGNVANPTNYLASDSATIIWAGILNTAYNNDVFGIGVDATSGLRQLRSSSLNTGNSDGSGIPGKGNLILSIASAPADKRFLMIGNDAATLAEQAIAAGTAPALIVGGGRTGREWKADNTGNVGAVTLTFDTTGFTYSGGNILSNYKLMIDADGDGNFNTGTVTFFNATSSADKQITFSGVTLPDNAVFTVVVKVPAGSLPATWLGFTAEAVNGDGLLNWKTSDEINVANYVVEHSTTGANFKEIGKVAAGNSTGVNSYTYTDPSLSAGTHYYRIRRVDLDGKFNYSVVKTIKISAVNAIQIRPNPVTGGNLTLAISLQQNTAATIQVVGVDGKVLSKKNVGLVQGMNTIPVDVTSIPTGVYLIQVQLNDEVASKKFIKVR